MRPMPRSYSAVYVHLIFATKGRRPYLSDSSLRSDTHSYLGGASKTLGCQSVIVGGVEDHVHILALCRATEHSFSCDVR
jgi:putative transposase